MTTFLLIRHGTHSLLSRTLVGRTPGVSLSDEGRTQAEQLAERIVAAGISVGAIYSSPMERATETAEPLSRRLGLPVQITDEFNELDFGDWTGLDFDALHSRPEWQSFNSFRSGARIPNGELMLEAQVRAVVGLGKLHLRHGEQTVAVVSHGDVIRAVLNYYLGAPLDLFRRLEISPGSISTLALHSWGPQVLRVNDTGPGPN